jgi:hypothetical protein
MFVSCATVTSVDDKSPELLIYVRFPVANVGNCKLLLIVIGVSTSFVFSVIGNVMTSLSLDPYPKTLNVLDDEPVYPRTGET